MEQFQKFDLAGLEVAFPQSELLPAQRFQFFSTAVPTDVYLHMLVYIYLVRSDAIGCQPIKAHKIKKRRKIQNFRVIFLVVYMEFHNINTVSPVILLAVGIAGGCYHF